MANIQFSGPQGDEGVSERQVQRRHCKTLDRVPRAPGPAEQNVSGSGKSWNLFMGAKAEPSTPSSKDPRLRAEGIGSGVSVGLLWLEVRTTELRRQKAYG
jgi:hypothetical protein